MKDIREMTQSEYVELLGRLAAAIQTQRRFVAIEKAERVSDTVMRYKVKRQGAYYRYLIEERAVGDGYKMSNLGVIL